MTERISRFTVPDLADVPEDVRNRILAVQEKAGFVPNVFLMLAHRPAEFRAFFDYHDALNRVAPERPGPLGPGRGAARLPFLHLRSPVSSCTGSPLGGCRSPWIG